MERNLKFYGTNWINWKKIEGMQSSRFVGKIGLVHISQTRIVFYAANDLSTDPFEKQPKPNICKFVQKVNRVRRIGGIVIYEDGKMGERKSRRDGLDRRSKQVRKPKIRVRGAG